MNSFKINTYQPTVSSYCYINELSNKSYLDINKFISGNDNVGLNLFLNVLTKNLTSKTNFDKFFALVYMRLVSLGPKVKLQSNKESVVTINLMNVLQRMLDNPQIALPDFYYKDMVIKFKLPSDLYYSNFLIFLLDIIDEITITNNLNNYKTLDKNKRFNIIKHFKKDILNNIKKHIIQNQNNYKIIETEEDIGFNNFKFSFYDNSAFYTVKFLFKTNISIIYNKMYHSLQKLRLNYEDYNNMTPSETNILLAIYKKSNNIK